ncbi:MAG: glycosyltransferase, partial [Bacteroidetes bacterium]|nr:glycosyltransferase [Bacteroidota bacterium]
SDADIVILHWVGKEMLSIAEIGKINKPIIWRLADQWAFCGAEHYTLSEKDKRYIDKYLTTNRNRNEKGFDINRWTWKRKIKHWYNKPMTIVTGSNWLADCAKSSYLFKNKRVEVIPSGLDMNSYKPVDKKVARQILNLPMNKKLILFGSMGANIDKRKGFHLLQPALKYLKKNSNIDMATVIFGASMPKFAPDFGMPSYYLSVLQDEWSLVLAYSAADVFVLPTMHDNLPYTIIESMACSTPCVSFRIGGLPDIIDHDINGFLATPFNTEELAEGIQTIIENDTLREEMSTNSRQKALEEYDVNIQVNKYLQLFDTL